MPPMRPAPSPRRPRLPACGGALLAGCGGGSDSTTDSSSAAAESRPAPPKSDFPSAKGKTARRGARIGRRPLRTRRLAGGRRSSTRARTATRSASSSATAPRSPTPKWRSTSPRCPERPTRRRKPARAAGADAARKRPKNERSTSPRSAPSRRRSKRCETQPAFRAQTTTSDPDAASVVYVDRRQLPQRRRVADRGPDQAGRRAHRDPAAERRWSAPSPGCRRSGRRRR